MFPSKGEDFNFPEDSSCGIFTAHSLQPILTINTLPNEMLHRILMGVRTKDLLRRCRLVSHVWHKTASSICRERRVRLIHWKKNNAIDAPHILYTLFDLENLPWSYYSFAYYGIPSSAQREDFFQKFGHHFLELRVQAESYANLLDILRWTPNLRSLVVIYIAEMARERCSYDELCAKNYDFRLSKLTRLQLNHSPQQTFLEYVLARCGARLEYFKSAFQIDDGQDQILSLLQIIPSLSLSISFDQKSLSATKNLIRANSRLKIHELSITLSQPGEPEQGRKTLFEEAESFLATFSDCLIRLEIVVWVTVSESLPQFKFPKFPKLNFLRLDFRQGKVSTGRFLSGMRGDQFPVLSQVAINLSRSRGNRGGVANYLFPKSCHFEQVRKIKMNVHDSVTDCWSRVFPSLRKLHITNEQDTGVSLDSIFSHSKLEHLSLVLISMDFEEVNAAFSDVSIENATGLKTLSLKMELHDNKSMHMDSGSDLFHALLRIQPLQLLRLIDFKISKECEADLKSYHRICEWD